MGRRDITGVDSNIGSEFKKGMNRYNATTSFRRDGVTYFIEINDMYGTNVIATWWDNSDNGFGYNNYGDVYVNNPFNRMTGSFSPENIDDYIGVNSAYDRNLPASLKKAIINRVKRYIDYDALNDVRRTESIKKGSKSNMKLRISEGDRSYKESKKRRTNGSNLKEATYKYRLVDGDTDEIINTFVDEKSAEEYARQYIRNWATDDDPVYVDCYRIDDEDAQTEYPKYLEDDEYMWTLDSLNGDWWKR